MPSKVLRYLGALALLCLCGTTAATLFGFLGRWHWLLDLFAHFRVQYIFLLAVAGVPLALQKRWRWTAGAAAFFALNLCFVLPLYWGNSSSAVAKQEALSLLVFNVNVANTGYERIATYLVEADADVVVILEATPGMELAISKRLVGYERIAETREDAFGMLAYSRLPMSSTQVRYLANSELPSLSFELSKDEVHYAILGLHTMPPVGGAHSALRDRMLVDAASWASDQENAILLGDLNATPWSYAFSDLLSEGKLINSQRGFGIQSSWPSGLWPMSIPIDHALHGQSLTTIERSVGPFLGSDHRPLHLRVGLALDSP